MRAHTHTDSQVEQRKNKREELKDICAILNIKVEENLLPSLVATNYMD